MISRLPPYIFPINRSDVISSFTLRSASHCFRRILHLSVYRRVTFFLNTASSGLIGLKKLGFNYFDDISRRLAQARCDVIADEMRDDESGTWRRWCRAHAGQRRRACKPRRKRPKCVDYRSPCPSITISGRRRTELLPARHYCHTGTRSVIEAFPSTPSRDFQEDDLSASSSISPPLIRWPINDFSDVACHRCMPATMRCGSFLYRSRKGYAMHARDALLLFFIY